MDREADMAYSITQGINIERPMEDKNVLFLFEEDKAITDRYAFDPAYGGKWILILPNHYMNRTWAECCRLYRKGQLTGIAFMKTSTSAYNPRQISPEEGVIMFHCGPSNDRAKMMSYGLNIVHELNCFSPFGHLPYKSDAQSQKGTRSTGNSNNSLYSIVLPKQPTSQLIETGRNFSSLYTNLRSEDVSTERIPSKVPDGYWLREENQRATEKYQCERAKSGRWLMVFNLDLLDKAWEKACKLYREEKLTGIHSMKVSTDKQSEGRHKYTGIILCFCGPSDDLDLVRSYGENLSKLMNYLNRTGYINYKQDNQEEILIRVEVPRT